MKRILVAAALLVCTPALAQQPTGKAQADLGTAPDRPWAKGVSPDEQRIAIDLFREGNGLLKESLFVQAAAKYREALRHWNHPGIHYNLALALLNLDQPVEVFAQLEEAMRYGSAPLDADKFDHATRYRALIEKQLARVLVTCEVAGAGVTLDGQPLFTAPGKYEGLVRVGQHTIVASKTGYVSTQKTPILLAGQRSTIDLKLFTADELTQYRRRWPNAMPWSVLAAGIVVAGVGGIMHWQASESIKSYDNGVSACGAQSPTGGCVPDATLAGKKSTGESLQGAAFAAYGVGAALVVTGGVLAYLNRARPYHVERDKLSLLPVLAPTGAGLIASLHF